MPKHTTPQLLDLGKSLRAERLRLTGSADPAKQERLAEIETLLAEVPEIRYCPLSGFGCADYVEEYAHVIEAAGVFDALKYGAAELRISATAIDLAGLAALGSAFTQALTKATGVAVDGSTKPNATKLRAFVLEHCKRFRVQIKDERGEWLNLDTIDLIDSHLDFGHMIDLVFALVGGVLRPLWSRLRSRAVETRNESPKLSTSATQAS